MWGAALDKESLGARFEASIQATVMDVASYRSARVLPGVLVALVVLLLGGIKADEAAAYESWDECYLISPEPWLCDRADYPDDSHPDWSESEIPAYMGQDSNWSPSPGRVVQGYGIEWGVLVHFRFSCNAIDDDQYDGHYRLKIFTRSSTYEWPVEEFRGNGCRVLWVLDRSDVGRISWQVFRGNTATSAKTSFRLTARPMKMKSNLLRSNPGSALNEYLWYRLDARARTRCAPSATLFVYRCVSRWRKKGKSRKWVTFMRRHGGYDTWDPSGGPSGPLNRWAAWYKRKPRGL